MKLHSIRAFISLCMLIGLFTIPVVQAQTRTSLACGDVFEDELTPDMQSLRYTILASPGTKLNIRVEPIGTTLNLFIRLRDAGNNEIGWMNENKKGIFEEIIEFDVSSTNPDIIIMGASADYTGRWNTDEFSETLGAYTLFLGCILRDGTVINPGEAVSDNGTKNSDGASSSPITDTGADDVPESSATSFTGFGFPGLAPVDFSEGVELPLIAGTPTLAPIAGDLVALYTYDASAETTAILSLSRASGDISIGVTVIHKDTNQIIFMGGMPFSDTLSVELNFPVDGTYVIGLFQLITKEASETSGAVEIMIE